MLTERVLAFGSFRLDAHTRSLTEDGRPVAIGDRALDLLIALIEQPGEVVSSAELMSRAWRGRFVDEANLRVQVSALRRALRDEEADPVYVATARGHGYCFIAKLAPPPLALAREPRSILPAALSAPVGRERDVVAVAERLRGTRLLTLVGPGGIGKTTLALACGRMIQGRYADGATYAEITGGVDPAVSVAASLGLRFLHDPTANLAAYVEPLEPLIIIDGCEYAADGAAQLAATILREAPRAVVLATSREPLRAEGEVVWRVEPLALPTELPVSVDEALGYGAIRLFAERARAADREFQFAEANIGAVTNICRRLDGVPLAIELAAGRVAAFGLMGVERGLDQRFHLLSEGRRTAPPRHRTLAAAVDWSYDSLSEEEQKALRGLSLFHGQFSASDAAQVAFGLASEAQDANAALAGLVSKSLVSADTGQVLVEYRLLDTTRDYARLKLEAADELSFTAARHASWILDVFSSAGDQLDLLPTPAWQAYFDRRIQDAQAALDWALSPNGDLTFVVPLTLACAPVWIRLTRPEECRRRVEAALTVVEPASPDEMALQIARVHALLMSGWRADAAPTAARRAIALARRLGDPKAELHGEWCLWNAHVGSLPSDLAEARQSAIRSQAIASAQGGPLDKLIADHLTAVTEFLSGNVTAARAAIDSVLRAIPSAWDANARLGWFVYDAEVSARNTLVDLLWLQGAPDRAVELGQANLAREGEATGNALARCEVLADSCCGIALSIGDLGAVERFLTLLDESARRAGLGGYRFWTEIVRATLAAERGDASPGLAFLGRQLPPACAHPRFAPILTELARALGEAGAREPARALADSLLRRIETTGERWIWSEVQRVRGELADDEATAVSLFERALEVARAQGARAWALRAATSLARRRPHTARDVLAPLLAGFTEGAGTKDHRAALEVLTASGVELT